MLRILRCIGVRLTESRRKREYYGFLVHGQAASLRQALRTPPHCLIRENPNGTTALGFLR